MSQSISLKKLAELAGVTPGTVSRALSGTGRMGSETRERILSLAKSVAYQPNLAARSMRTRKMNTIGLLVPLGHDAAQHLSDPFFSTMTSHLADALSREGYDILLSRVEPVDNFWIDNFVRSGRVDGIIVIGQSDQFAAIETASLDYHPMVVWGGQAPDQQHCSIGCNNRLGGQIAAQRLREQGCRDMLYLGPTRGLEFSARVLGAREALANDRSCRLTVIDAHCSLIAGPAQASAIFDSLPRLPDGIFAGSDVTAMSILNALAARGLHVPKDVKVVGFDGLPLGALASPPLTTIDQHISQAAGIMVDVLMRRLNGEPTQSIIMTPSLIVRESG